MRSRGIGDRAPGSEAEDAGARGREDPERSVLETLPATSPLRAAPEDGLAGAAFLIPEFPRLGNAPPESVLGGTTLRVLRASRRQG